MKIWDRNLATRVHKTCVSCGDSFWVPHCRVKREHACSNECKIAARKAESARLKDDRTRTCIACAASFVVKKSQIDYGQGKYCSGPCAWKAERKPLSEETIRKKRASMIALIESGKFKHKTGPDNPLWKGGKEEARKRAAPKMAGRTREYRKNNPDKVREFWQNRRARKIGQKRLPRGTVAKLLTMQRGKCAICKSPHGENYHVDHIMPLKLGGEHHPHNIQILCVTCNVRKSAKHPIHYMQERGMLL